MRKYNTGGGDSSRLMVEEKLRARAYKVKVKNLGGMSAKEFTRFQLDHLGIGAGLSEIPWGRKKVKQPSSRLAH